MEFLHFTIQRQFINQQAQEHTSASQIFHAGAIFLLQLWKGDQKSKSKIYNYNFLQRFQIFHFLGSWAVREIQTFDLGDEFKIIVDSFWDFSVHFFENFRDRNIMWFLTRLNRKNMIQHTVCTVNPRVWSDIKNPRYVLQKIRQFFFKGRVNYFYLIILYR